MQESFYDVITEKCGGCIDIQPNHVAHDLCLMEDVEMQVLTCFDTLLEKVDNFQMNELCFTFTLPISMEKLYLNILELKTIPIG